MKEYKAQTIIILMTLMLWSCNGPNLDGHYHLVWKNKHERFQTWNIRNNRMVINGPVCQPRDSCFASVISFKERVITISPWVDNIYSTRYTIDDKGIIAMHGDSDTLWLIPYHDCITAKNYFNDKTIEFTSDFQLTDTFKSITGVHRFPNTFENELIVGSASDSLFYIFNGRAIRESLDGRFGFVHGGGETVWIHVDKRTPVGAVAPLMSELFDNGYKVQYSLLETSENDEQIILLERQITQVNKHPDRIEIETCAHCEKYPPVIPDTIVPVKMLGVDLFILNGDTNDLFQTRNALVRYIGRNRTSRLRSEIQIEINRNTSFSDYLALIDELLWVHVEVSSITYYKGKDDPDATWIRKKQEDIQAQDLGAEFPIRVREIIK